MSYVSSATKTITKATPTVDLYGNVVKWEVSIKYLLNGYESNFTREVEVEPTKAPGDFTKSELFNIAGEYLLDEVFNSQYESTQVLVEVTEIKVDDFDVDSLV